MRNTGRILFLLVMILFLSLILTYFLNLVGIINIQKDIPFLGYENPEIIDDLEYPTEVDKLKIEKEREKLIEQEEKLAIREIELKEKEEDMERKMMEIKEIRKGIQEERKRLMLLANDIKDRKKNIRDIANKVRNMPPERAVEMMRNWQHFDIIEVIRQIDADSEREGLPTITPYLLTLFEPEERAEITRKMLLQPIEVDEENQE